MAMTLTTEDLKAIEYLLDTKLEEKLEQKLEEKLEQKLEEKLDQKLDEKLDQKLDEKLDEKFRPINRRLDVLEFKQNLMSKKLDDLQLDIKISERDIRRDIHRLNDEMETVIEILKQNEMIPQ